MPLGPRPLSPTAAPTAATATAATATTAAPAAPACCATMASLRFLAFDHEGRPVQFDMWLDDLQLYLLSDSKDSVSLFDLASGAATAPPSTADSATHSQWLTCDATARLAIRNHLPLRETQMHQTSRPRALTQRRLRSTGTYVDEVPPPGANIVDGMWILRVKRPPGSPPAFKARYVARGFSQRQGVDYFQTFSPNPKIATLQVLLHVAAQRDNELHSLDFSTAFLQGTLHEEIWLRHPPGFTGSFPAGPGFAPSTADPSLFLHTDTSLPPFYVLVYVNDLVFATTDNEALTLVKTELQKRHTCTDLGELRSYLGLQITRDRARRTITLTQSHMVHQVLQCFGFQFSSPQPTPLTTSHSLSAPPSDESVEPSGPYPELVGCLMYMMTCTRPDLAYPLSLLARYVAPGRHRKVHWDDAKRVLRYLCSTSGMGLVLGGRGPVVLTGHADASWVDH
ncbi:unnamed protein product [Closterium sp. NIES-54]